MKKIIAFLATLAFISPVVASAAPYIVNQGGTGASTFTAGQLLVGNGKNPITGTSSPTVSSINTSSTTATSTFAGNAYVKGNLQVDGNFFAPVSLVSSGNATINGILTVTGVSKFSDGAVGTPGLSFANDTNTGIYRLGNDILSLVTNGADRLTINASGNVGIGTTTPASKLEVNGGVIRLSNSATTNATAFFGTSGAANQLINGDVAGDLGIVTTGSKINFSANNGTANHLVITSAGNVGIGTSTPIAKLDVVGTFNNHLTVGGTPNAAGNISFRRGTDGGTTGRIGWLTNTTGTQFGIENGSSGGEIRLNPNHVDNSGFVTLYSANAETVRIRSGSVGIGTTNPSQKLEINGGMRLNTATAKPTCDSTVRGTFWFTQSGAGVKDAVEVCAKDAADAYAWRTIY